MNMILIWKTLTSSTCRDVRLPHWLCIDHFNQLWESTSSTNTPSLRGVCVSHIYRSWNVRTEWLLVHSFPLWEANVAGLCEVYLWMSLWLHRHHESSHQSVCSCLSFRESPWRRCCLVSVVTKHTKHWTLYQTDLCEHFIYHSSTAGPTWHQPKVRSTLKM